MPGTFIALQAE